METEKILQVLKRFKEQNGDKYYLKRIGIFGSAARGEKNENSDIDIVVEQIKPDMYLLGDLKTDLEEIFSQRVDVVRLRKNMNQFLYQRIQRDAMYV